MREKRNGFASTGAISGITPASAGKTKGFDKNLTAYWDHPRECGKNQFFSRIQLCCIGSPPRVREKLEWLVVVAKPTRITPASAGKTEIDKVPIALG